MSDARSAMAIAHWAYEYCGRWWRVCGSEIRRMDGAQADCVTCLTCLRYDNAGSRWRPVNE